MQKRHNQYRLCRFYIYTNIYISTIHLCLLSNASMLAVKCIYACYQMNLCLLSNESMLAVKCIYACCQRCFLTIKNSISFADIAP